VAFFKRQPKTPDRDSVPCEYPDWEGVRKDLSHLPKGLLSQLRKAMVFVVCEDGKEHAAVIARAESSEFQSVVTSSTPMRLHIDFYSGRLGDVFGVYPLVLDNQNDPAFKETWLLPYDDEPDVRAKDPLSAESRKRLRLLLRQQYAWLIFVDGHDRILWVRRVGFTGEQLKSFKKYDGTLDRYAGKTLGQGRHIPLLTEYLNAVSTDALRRQFLELFRQKEGR
jgi:hypothetical protein